jgi:chorismate synthase
MLRLLTAGESHGKALVATLEGLPAGIPVSDKGLADEMARRRHGYGRSGRQSFEGDRFEVLGGLRHSRTLGSPIALTIENTEWEAKYRERMAPFGDPDPSERLTRPRPGHADLAGMQKYGTDDARDILERASARETAARVALAYFCKAFLAELGIAVVSHVVAIGPERVDAELEPPGPGDLEAVDGSPVRCADPSASERMVAVIDEARRAGDSLGGVFEVLAYGVPPGLGSHIQWDRRLDARLAQALMSIQSVKAAAVGDGMRAAEVPGSQAHDEILPSERGAVRATSRAGGIEGGMSNGSVIRVHAAMKPLSTLPRPLRTIDVDTGEAAEAITQRTDVCAVPSGAVVGEAMVAVVLADAVLEKFGGDALLETKRNLESFVRELPWNAGTST